MAAQDPVEAPFGGADMIPDPFSHLLHPGIFVLQRIGRKWNGKIASAVPSVQHEEEACFEQRKEEKASTLEEKYAPRNAKNTVLSNDNAGLIGCASGAGGEDEEAFWDDLTSCLEALAI